MPRSQHAADLSGPSSRQRPTSEWGRLFRRVRADLAQMQDDLQALRAQTRRYLEIEATRPLTADEAKQAWAFHRQGHALRLRLHQLRGEVTQLPGQPRQK